MKKTPSHYLKSFSWSHTLGWLGLIAVVAAVGTYAWSRVEARHGEVEIHGPVIGSVAGLKEVAEVVDVSSCRLTVALYNIRQAQGPLEGDPHTMPGPHTDYLRTIGDVLAQASPDVVVLNEVAMDEPMSDRNQAATIAERLGLRWHATQSNYSSSLLTSEWSYGNAVLSRFPMREANYLEMPARSRWRAWAWGHNEGLEVLIDAPTGTVRVMAVHLDHKDEAVREHSVEIVAERFDEDSPPTIVAGDMNAVAQSKTIGTLAQLPALESAGTGPTWSSTDPHKKIDWVFVPADWEVIEATELQTTASDHLPVVVTLRAPGCSPD